MKAYEKPLGVTFDLIVILDRNDLYDTISTCRRATDCSVRGDVALIRYYFEVRSIMRMVWFLGSANLADPLTKTDSPLTNALLILLYSGKLPCDFSVSKSRHSVLSTGCAIIMAGV